LTVAALCLVGLIVVYFKGADPRYRPLTLSILALGSYIGLLRAKRIKEDILSGPESERAKLPQTKMEYVVRNIPTIVLSALGMIAGFFLLGGQRGFAH
jgi:hypothetical protein